MSNTPTDDELARFHRYFAVESNNRAWQATIGPEEERNYLDILQHAYVSAYHWSVVGTELNEFRANILLAHAHAYCGHGETAMEYVRRYRAYMEHHDVVGWESSFAVMIHAQAAYALGKKDLHATLYAEAKTLVEGTQDEADKAVLMFTWVNIPKP